MLAEHKRRLMPLLNLWFASSLLGYQKFCATSTESALEGERLVSICWNLFFFLRKLTCQLNSLHRLIP